MRRPQSGWAASSPRRWRPPTRFAVLVFLVPLVAGMFAVPVARVASGDQLSDARAAKQALEAKIAAQRAKIAQLNQQQAVIRSQIGQTTRSLTAVNADLVATRAQVATMVGQIKQVQATYDDLVAQIAQLDASIAQIAQQEDEKAQDLATRKALLAERIRSAYESGRTSLLETLLSGQSFADILTQVGYFLDVGQQDKALAQQISADQGTLAALHQTVADTRAQTDDLRQQTADQKVQLDGQLADLTAAQARLKQLEQATARALAQQQAGWARLATNKAAVARELAADAAAEHKLQAQINRLLAQQAAYSSIPSVFNGTFQWPLVGEVTQPFGCTGYPWEPPEGSCAHYHDGIDIAAPMYTPIHAAADGTVIFAGPNPYDPYPKAWIVIIAHSKNLLTWYAHVDNATRPPTVRPGDIVHQGDVIAYVGMTGRTTGPHLHWMVELNDTFVNPRLFV